MPLPSLFAKATSVFASLVYWTAKLLSELTELTTLSTDVSTYLLFAASPSLTGDARLVMEVPAIFTPLSLICTFPPIVTEVKFGVGDSANVIALPSAASGVIVILPSSPDFNVTVSPAAICWLSASPTFKFQPPEPDPALYPSSAFFRVSTFTASYL